MNPIAQKYGADPLVGVNLIPREIAARKTMRTVRLGAILGVLGAVVVVGLAYAFAVFERQSAAEDRDQAAQDELAAVAARDGKRDIYLQVEAREQEEYTLAQIGYAEIDYAALTASIQSAFTGDTGLETIQIQGPNAEGTVAGSGDTSIYANGVGVVTVSARATSYEEATDLIARLEALPGLAEMRATPEAYETEGAETYYAFDVTGVITAELLNGRLIPESGISNAAQVLTGTVRPEPEVSASAEPQPSTEPESEEG